MEQNLDITKLRYGERILPVPWPPVMSRLHCHGSLPRFIFVYALSVLLLLLLLFVNCLYVARFIIVHSKTQIKFPLLYYYSLKEVV